MGAYSHDGWTQVGRTPDGAAVYMQADELKEADEQRERLRLDLETFLREKYQLGEEWASEQWDDALLAHSGETVAAAIFRGPGAAVIMRMDTIESFNRWRASRE